jgi:hypothetical protein
VTEEQEHNRLSRRDALTRIGVVGAVAWSAPIISSIRTPAFAQSPSCLPWECGDPIVECGSPCGIGPCVCDVDVEGNSFCWDNYSCDPACGAIACTSNTDCDAIGSGNWGCIVSCCGNPTCAPPCGECDLCGNVKGRRRTGAGQR